MSRMYQTPRPTSPPVVPTLLPPSLAHAWPRWQCVLFLSVDEDFPCPMTAALLGDWSLAELRDRCVHELLKLQLGHISELEGTLRSYRQELSTIRPFAPGARSSPPVPFLDELHDRFADQGCPTVVSEGPSLSPFLPRPLPEVLQARGDSADYASTPSSSP